MNLVSIDLEELALRLDEAQFAGTLSPELDALWTGAQDAGYESIAVDPSEGAAAAQAVERNIQAFRPLLTGLAEREGEVPESVRNALAALNSDLDRLDDVLLVEATPLALRRKHCCMFFDEVGNRGDRFPMFCDTITATSVGAGIRCGLRAGVGFNGIEVHGGSCREQEARRGIIVDDPWPWN